MTNNINLTSTFLRKTPVYESLRVRSVIILGAWCLFMGFITPEGIPRFGLPKYPQAHSCVAITSAKVQRRRNRL